MFLSFSLDHGIVVLGMVSVALLRFRRSGLPAEAKPAAEEVIPEVPFSVDDPERLPERATMAGVPLRIVLSDPCGPGAALRDSLMYGPPPSNL